jgi:DNA-binding Xre family transcriptional regulator
MKSKKRGSGGLMAIEITIAEQALQKGLTTAYKLQKATGLAPSVAARLFSGDFKQISLETLEKLCKALECQPNQLFRYYCDLNDLELSIRTQKALEGAGIETVEELMKMPVSKLLAIRDFGKKALNEIKAALAKRGLSLTDDLRDYFRSDDD